MLHALGRPARLALGLALLAAGPILPQAAADTVALSVDVSRPGPKIDRNIFGQFAEHLGTGVYEGVWVGPDSSIPNTRGIRNDVVAALKALKVPNVRWPGGCFADEYHWRKGVGPEPPGHPQPQLGRRHRAEHASAPTSSWTSSTRSAARPSSPSTSARAPRRKPRSGWST